MIQQFIKIRFLQIGRELRGISPVSFIICAAVLFVMGAGLFQALVNAASNHSYNSYYITIAIAAVILWIQINRKDKKFISNTLTKPFQLYFIEYFIFSIPLILLLLFSANWLCALLLVLVYLPIATVSYNFSRKNTRLNLSAYISTFNFEWIAGLRNNLISLLTIYFAAMALSFVNILSLLLLWLLTVIISSFYEECEPYEVICSPGLNPQAFLNQKLETHLKIYIALITPVIIIYCCLNPASIFFALCFMIAGSINIAYFIVSKYMLYQPQAKLRANNVNYALVLGSIILVFLLPLPLVMLFRNYKRAVLNLKNYLNDYY